MKILPCWYCNTPVTYENIKSKFEGGHFSRAVICPICGASGPRAEKIFPVDDAREKAIEKWNDRQHTGIMEKIIFEALKKARTQLGALVSACIEFDPGERVMVNGITMKITAKKNGKNFHRRIFLGNNLITMHPNTIKAMLNNTIKYLVAAMQPPIGDRILKEKQDFIDEHDYAPSFICLGEEEYKLFYDLVNREPVETTSIEICHKGLRIFDMDVIKVDKQNFLKVGI